MIRRRTQALLVLIAGLTLPLTTYAAVGISEIMYDVPGANTNRQWIEVVNTGNTSIDLGAKEIRLVDKNGNHLIKEAQGSTVLAPAAAAVIAQNPSGFLADYPHYSGILLKSSFTLSAVSTIHIGQPSETDGTDGSNSSAPTSISYTSALGAKGDGNSLQFSQKTHTFISGAPTPGFFPTVPPAPIPSSVKLSAGINGTNTKASGPHSKSPSKRTTNSSSHSTYDSGSIAPADTADAGSAGAPFTLPAFILPYVFIFSSIWFASFLGLITFSGFSLFVIQRQYRYD